MIVIIPCGGKKASEPCQAELMYQGCYHVCCLKYAYHIVRGDKNKIFILSAKYGLLRLADRIQPYELRMGQKGQVSMAQVALQALSLGIRDQEAVALGGKEYVNICRAVFRNLKTPLEGVGGIGKQLAWMTNEIEKIKAQEALKAKEMV